ncbi:Inosine-uridine preferring nucleoside hydrolase family protein [Melia azedarach]|nr:Inosine-uridine preferring nucleoside hydrolase family protein [Melia azedarach]
MMNRDDIPVGVGGDGGILPNGTILPNVGGYHPIMDQGMSTAGGCRYRQAIPVGQRGRLSVDTNYGLRKAFLPQGGRKYTPLEQPTAQQVMINAISEGPTTVFIMGSHTNFAIFIMNNPHLKKNVEHIYAMGGAIRPNCSNGTNSEHCSSPVGNLYPQDSNPYAEYNIFSDPFAAYTVLHSGIPVTLIPLDATNTIPVSKSFFIEFERRQNTYEAQYCFQSLKMIRDTWHGDQFYEAYCMWDSFMAGVALSIMRNSQSHSGENEFSEMEYMNLTVVTSNKPYGISDGSNPLIEGLAIPKFNVQKNGVHSGHVQMGMQDPFCLQSEKRKCQDGYTKEVTGPEAVEVLVATKAKPNQDIGNLLEKEFYKSFLEVINFPKQAGRFNISARSPHYKEVLQKPDSGKKSKGKPVVFDMDMSAGDFLALIYLLKLPADTINLKGIMICSTGWATAATVDVVYDLLHMLGRDDIPVGLGDVFAIGEANPTFSAIGDCKYSKAVPQGSGGLLDSDTLYGLARDLPRSARRYTVESSVDFGAPRNTDHPELRQPSALDVWKSIVESLEPGLKITVLTNGPLTNLAQIIDLKNSSLVIQDVYIVGGNIGQDNEKGNVFTVPSNKYAELNMFFDPLAAKAVFESKLDIKLIPLHMQRRVNSFENILDKLQVNPNGTPESSFSQHLLSRLRQLQQRHNNYHHVDTFLGEILGAIILGGHQHHLNQTYRMKPLKIVSDGDISKVGQIVVNENQGKLVKLLDSFNEEAYYDRFGQVLEDQNQ